MSIHAIWRFQAGQPIYVLDQPKKRNLAHCGKPGDKIMGHYRLTELLASDIFNNGYEKLLAKVRFKDNEQNNSYV